MPPLPHSTPHAEGSRSQFYRPLDRRHLDVINRLHRYMGPRRPVELLAVSDKEIYSQLGAFSKNTGGDQTTTKPPSESIRLDQLGVLQVTRLAHWSLPSTITPAHCCASRSASTSRPTKHNVLSADLRCLFPSCPKDSPNARSSMTSNERNMNHLSTFARLISRFSVESRLNASLILAPMRGRNTLRGVACTCGVHLGQWC